MISKIHRFHGHNSVRSVYQKGRTVRGNQWTLKVSPARQSNYRLAVVVSKKVSKSAVMRNRIRRRLYEAARNSRLAAVPVDVIITVFSDQVADMPFGDIEKTLGAQLEQVIKTSDR